MKGGLIEMYQGRKYLRLQVLSELWLYKYH